MTRGALGRGVPGARGKGRRRGSDGPRALAGGLRRHGASVPPRDGMERSSEGGGGVSITVIVLLLLVAGACMALGRWQLERAREQQALEVRGKAALSMEELALGDASISERDAYRRASADGIYDSTQQFYLDGRRHGNQMGYHVITALRLVGTRRYVLVNRGWMPEEKSAAPVPVGKVHVSGVLTKAQLPGLLLGEPRGTTRPWIDPRAYAAESGRSVEPLLLVASGASTSLVPVGVERASKETMHRGYALQWFSFAAMAAGAAGVMGWRRVRHGR